MLNQLNKLLLLTGLLLILISFFLSKKTLDIHVHDTYYVIALNHVCWALAVLLLLFSLLYWWTNNMLFSTTLTWIHVAATIFMAASIVSAPIWLQMVEQSFSNDIFTAMEQKSKFYRGLRIFGLLLLALQLAFFINLIGGLIKRYT